MSIDDWSRSRRQVAVTACPSRPIDRATTTGVVAGRLAASISMARARPRRRRFDAGLYRATTKSPAAAASSRRSITAHGVSKSDNETAQKSWPSGAPASAAAPCIADTPGSTTISLRRQPGSVAVSSRSNTSAAMAYTPGSPEQISATR